MVNIQQVREEAIENKTIFIKLFEFLRRKKPKDLDKVVIEYTDDSFKKTDCLQCANCCKTVGPLFTPSDISRIAGTFKQRPNDFIDQYLRKDEDNDYVLKSTPCTFLNADNSCFIYDIRPKACREFPHTDRKKLYQIDKETIQNTENCPIALDVVKNIQEYYRGNKSST